jgi:hypothetical protein
LLKKLLLQRLLRRMLLRHLLLLLEAEILLRVKIFSMQIVRLVTN